MRPFFVVMCLAYSSRGRSHENSATSLDALGFALSQSSLREVLPLKQLALFFLNCVPLVSWQPLGSMSGCGGRLSRHPKSSDASQWSVDGLLSNSKYRPVLVAPRRGNTMMEDVGGRGVIELVDEAGMLDFQAVMETLKADIPNILRKEPNQTLFANDFHVYDQTGGRLDDSQPGELLELLRSVTGKFNVNETSRVELMTPEKSLGIKPYLVARWSVYVHGLTEVDSADAEIELIAETIFHLNDKNEVDYVWIDNRYLNGQRLFSWPELDLSDGSSKNLARVEEWLNDVQATLIRNSTAIGTLLESEQRLQADCDDNCLIERVGVFDKDLTAMDSLQDVLPKLLSLEPDWNNFAEDFKLVTEKNFTINGQGFFKGFLSFLRVLQSRLEDETVTDYIRDEYTVEKETFFEKNAEGDDEEKMFARWSIRLFRPNLQVPSLEKSKAGFLVISGETTFSFNSEGKVSSLALGSWLFNGAKLPPIALIIFIISLLDDAVIALVAGGGVTAGAKKIAVKGSVVYAGAASVCDDLIQQFTDSPDVEAKICGTFPEIQDLQELYSDLRTLPESGEPFDGMSGVFLKVQDALYPPDAVSGAVHWFQEAVSQIAR